MERKDSCVGWWANRAAGFAVVAGLAASASGQVTNSEVEPNDNKPTAQVITGIASGDTIVGNSQGSPSFGNDPAAGSPTSADYFRISTQAASLGIYQHRLTFTSVSTLNNVSVRCLSQSDGSPATVPSAVDGAATGSTAAVRFTQWYGFGKQEEVYVRAGGTAATTDDYTLTYSRMPITAVDLGTVIPGGVMTITTVGQGHTTDTDFWVYDSNLNAIPGYGNDNGAVAGDASRSRITREFTAAGDYYIAISNSNVANNMLSPNDELTRSNNYLDFPNAVTNAQSTVNNNVSLAIVDGAGVSHPVALTKTEAFQVLWVKFTISAPVSGACCMPSGACTVVSSAGCALNGGTYAGDGVTCGGANCVQPPVGACCLLDSNCTVVSSYACADANGNWAGAATTCAAANCPSIASTFLGNSGLGIAATSFFSVTPSSDYELTALDVYCAQTRGTTLNMKIYTYDGDYLGVYNNAAAWMEVQTVVATSAGIQNRTYIPFTAPIAVANGETKSFALVTTTVGLRFTASTGGLQPGWAPEMGNSDLAIYSDRTSAGSFGTATTARSWAGNVYYREQSGPACSADFNGTGGVTVDDIFAFLDAWFAQNGQTGPGHTADFNASNDVTADDIFAFLDAWFAQNGACN